MVPRPLAAEDHILECYGSATVKLAVRALQMWPEFCQTWPKICDDVVTHLRCTVEEILPVIADVRRWTPELPASYKRLDDDPLILLPPTSTCNFCEYRYNCDSGNAGDPIVLSLHHEPASQCFLADIDGSETPCWHYKMRCRSCHSSYGYAPYKNFKSNKFFLYEKQREFVYVSRNCLWTRRFCEVLTQDMFVKQCSFMSFATAIHNAFEHTSDYNRKQAAEAFFKFHIEKELRFFNKTDVFGFTHECDWDQALAYLNQINASRLYPHSCTALCLGRGCLWIKCIDGNWKLTHKHCAYRLKKTHPYFPSLHFPDCCTNEPQSGKLFCEAHLGKATKEGLPVTQSGLKFAKKVTDPSTHSAGDLPTGTPAGCNKNKRNRKYGHARSRGWLFVVTAGGAIRFFRPLYSSESSSQVFYATIEYLFLELQDRKRYPESLWEKFVLCYDDMCHLDGLLQAQQDLRLPAPYDTMWAKITKVIDRFHLRNHVRPICHTQYNPEKINDLHGVDAHYNTQGAEQTFSWMKNFKSTVFNMAKNRQEFFLNIMVKLYNFHLEMSMKKGQFPIHYNSRRRLNSI